MSFIQTKRGESGWYCALRNDDFIPPVFCKKRREIQDEEFIWFGPYHDFKTAKSKLVERLTREAEAYAFALRQVKKLKSEDL